jgi:DNA-binding MarR family transcriptional regulator
MPQAIKERRRAAVDPALERIQSSLAVIAQSIHQARSHERLLAAAGVRVDRAGATLLGKLHASTDGALRVTDLAERLGVDTPTVTRKVQQLERLGLVEREPDPDDRRAFRITCTDEGREVVGRLLDAKRARLASLLDGWSATDRRTFAALLSRFTDRLQAELDR